MHWFLWKFHGKSKADYDNAFLIALCINFNRQANKKEEKVEDFELKVYEKARKKAGLTELAKYSDLMNVAYSPASEFKNVSAKLLVSKPTDADITLGKIFDQKALQLQMMSGTGLWIERQRMRKRSQTF